MIYNMLLCLIAFLATRYVIIKDLAFYSPLNNPPERTNSIYEGVTSENHCPQEGQVEAKDYDTDIREVMNQYTQYKSQHEKNKQEIKSEFGIRRVVLGSAQTS